MRVNYVNKPLMPVTVTVIGAGGNGSQILNQLGRINYALTKLGRPGLFVTLVDKDKVSESNCGRQLFNESEIGEYKAVVLITRINRFYGTNWRADCSMFSSKEKFYESNIFITCTDTADSRIDFQRYMKKLKVNRQHEFNFCYWMDMGNTKNTGQIIVGNKELPTVVDMYPEMKKMAKKDDTPTCSLAEALAKQDLFINTFISNVAAKLLWEMFMNEEVNWRGAYVNLDTMNFKKIAA